MVVEHVCRIVGMATMQAMINSLIMVFVLVARLDAFNAHQHIIALCVIIRVILPYTYSMGYV